VVTHFSTFQRTKVNYGKKIKECHNYAVSCLMTWKRIVTERCNNGLQFYTIAISSPRHCLQQELNFKKLCETLTMLSGFKSPQALEEIGGWLQFQIVDNGWSRANNSLFTGPIPMTMDWSTSLCMVCTFHLHNNIMWLTEKVCLFGMLGEWGVLIDQFCR
jgi:hypothetical protein